MAFSSSFDASSLEHKLLLAAYVGHLHSFKEVAVLLDRGKDCLLEAVEAVRDTNCEFGAFHMAAASGSLPLCQYLAENLLMDIGALDKLGQTPLSYAVSYERSEVILYLLNRGANPDKPNVQGFTPLHYAVGGGNLEVIKVLLSSKSVVVNRLSTQGTALHIAATFGNENAIKLLLDNGANFQIKANDYTPLALALLVPSPKCVKILMEAGAAVEDIHPVPSTMLSANNGLSNCMRRLLEAGADLDLLYDDDDPEDHALLIPFPLCTDVSCHQKARFAIGCCGRSYCTVQHALGNHPNSHAIGVPKVIKSVMSEDVLEAEVPGCVHPDCPPWWLQKASRSGDQIVYEFRSSDPIVGNQMIHSYPVGQNEPAVRF